jgi:4-amino-4-deoxy-L-arabinose transferase-like glycosyltransferase
MSSPDETTKPCALGWAGWCRRVQPWQLATALCAVVLVSGLGGYPLLDPDEGRYGEISREMLERHDFVSPMLNYVPYWEKPPLLYWLNAAALHLLGETPFAVRIGTALIAVLGLLVAWWLARVTFGSRAARWAPGILAGSWMYHVVARIPIIDMLFSVLLAASLTAWWSAENSAGGARRRRWVLAGVFLGLAVLAKGPVAMVLFAGTAGAYLILQRRWLDLVTGTLTPLTVSALVAAPWFVAMARANPTFLHEFFWVQHVERFLGTSGHVEHAKPFWYYFAMASPGFFPWSFLWPGMIAWLVTRWRGLPAGHRRVAHYLLAWALVTMLFFSASSCKLVQYVLPAWWPLAIAAAAWLAAKVDDRQMPPVIRRGLIAFGCFLVLLIVALIALAGRQQEIPQEALRHPLAITALVGTMCAALFLLVGLAGNADRRLALLIAAGILPLFGLIPMVGQFAMRRDMNGLIPPEIMALSDSTPWTIAQYGCYNQALNFYTHQRVILIDHVNELGLGLRQPDAWQWFLTGEETIRQLSARGPLALVVRTERAPDLARRYHLRAWGSNQDRAMLLNRAGLRYLDLSNRSRDRTEHGSRPFPAQTRRGKGSPWRK